MILSGKVLDRWSESFIKHHSINQSKFANMAESFNSFLVVMNRMYNLLWTGCKKCTVCSLIYTVHYLYPCKTNVCVGILESAYLSIHVSVCVQNTSNFLSQSLQFCFNRINTLHIHWSLQETILKCQLHLVEELSPLELRNFLWNCLFQSKCLCHIQWQL